MNRSILPRLLCLVGATMIGGFGMYFIFLRNSEPMIRLDDAASANLGVIPLQVPTTRTLTLVNDSRDPIHVARIASSCGCTSIDPQQIQIQPGGVAKIHVTLEPLSLEDGKDIPRRRRLGLQLMVVIDHPRSKAFRIPLEATIESVLSSFPKVAGFESWSSDVVNGTLEVISHDPLDRLDVLSVDKSLLTRTVRSFDGRHHQVHVSATCKTPETISARLELRPVTQSGLTASPYTADVYVTRSADVQCVESFISFGVLESGVSQSRSLRLVSMSQHPFTVRECIWKSANSSADNIIQVLPSPSESACEARFTVSTTAGVADDRGGGIVFLIVQGDLEYPVTVPVMLQHARQPIVTTKAN